MQLTEQELELTRELKNQAIHELVRAFAACKQGNTDDAVEHFWHARSYGDQAIGMLESLEALTDQQ